MFVFYCSGRFESSGSNMWEMEGSDCDCLGPPPEFLLPPPPKPPLLQPPDYICSDNSIPNLEACDIEPVSIFSTKRIVHIKLFVKTVC